MKPFSNLAACRALIFSDCSLTIVHKVGKQPAQSVSQWLLHYQAHDLECGISRMGLLGLMRACVHACLAFQRASSLLLQPQTMDVEE